jgi:FAD/FMN-containing dehydrogenase
VSNSDGARSRRAVVRSRLDWEALRKGLAGGVLLPGSEEYEWARRPFIARFDELEPQAIVRCAVPADVAAAIEFAASSRLQIAARSGGHCLAGFSSTRGTVIDVSPMCEVRVADGVVRVGAGTRTGELCERLCEHGLAIPTGTCPTVGIAGLTLGGGLGLLGRAYGLTLDHLLAAQIVLADGQVLECDEHHAPDLFWGLRGAGAGNFGVVTAFTFAPVPAPAMANFQVVWPYQHAAAVIAAWQGWAANGPDELSADLVLTAPADPTSDPAAEVYGAVIGDERDALTLLEGLAARVGADPQSLACTELSYRDTCRYQAELSVAYDQIEQTPQGPRRRQGYRITKSEFFDRPLPREAMTAFLDNFAAMRAAGESRSVGFAPWGGAYNRRSPTATAFAHRDQLFSLEHLVIVEPAAPDAAKRAARDWVTRSWESVHPFGSGRVYPCFPDADLSDWGRAYYADNYPPLLEIKAKYDPENVFRFEQSLPLA